MRNLYEDRMKKNLNMAAYNIFKEDMYKMTMEESNSFIEGKYKVNLDDISSDEEEDEDNTSPKYVHFNKIWGKLNIVANNDYSSQSVQVFSSSSMGAHC